MIKDFTPKELVENLQTKGHVSITKAKKILDLIKDYDYKETSY